MHKTTALLCALIFATATVTGCANWSNSDTGTVAGGALGGLLGSQIGHGSGKTIATVVGALGGAALGNYVGNRFDQRDRKQFGSVLESQPTGHTSQWNNPDTDSSYSVTPTRTYKQNQKDCRDFTMNANVEGQTKKVTGTACRQADGQWKVVS